MKQAAEATDLHDAANALRRTAEQLETCRDEQLMALVHTVARLEQEVGSVRHDIHTLTHVVSELHHLAKDGAPEGLPLLVGFLDRIRLDAETAVAATSVIERQLARLSISERISPEPSRP